MTTVSQSLPTPLNQNREAGIPCKISGSGALLNEEVKLEQEARTQSLDFSCSPQHLLCVIEVIKQFCHKYLDDHSESTVNHILRKISMMGYGILSQKGSREMVAAVVYCQYSGIIRLKLKDFSVMNQLNNKIFNKKYVAYQTLLKRRACPSLENESNQAKLEQKLEESPEKEEEILSEEINQDHEARPIANVKQAIELIYDGIFKSNYFQNNRRELIEKMAQRCSEIDPKIYEEMTWTQNYSVKLYHAIFQHFKELGMNINFTQFREAVENFTGIHLKRSYMYPTQKLFRKMEKLAFTEGESSSSPNAEPVSL